MMSDGWTLPTTRRGALLVERRLLPTAPGATALRQRFVGTDQRVVVTNVAGIVALVEVVEGALFFAAGTDERRAPNKFVLAIPPRSCVRLRFETAVVTSDGLGWVDRDARLAAQPPRVGVAATKTPLEREALLASDTLFEMPCDRDVDRRIASARRGLHQHLGSLAPVRRVAAELSLSPDVLTRGFARAYGLTPKRYCNRARLFDAVMHLLMGADIARTAFDTGFGDLSRFYAQFRGLLGTTPGRYASVGKRQDGRFTDE